MTTLRMSQFNLNICLSFFVLLHFVLLLLLESRTSASRERSWRSVVSGDPLEVRTGGAQGLKSFRKPASQPTVVSIVDWQQCKWPSSKGYYPRLKDGKKIWLKGKICHLISFIYVIIKEIDTTFVSGLSNHIHWSSTTWSRLTDRLSVRKVNRIRDLG